MGVARLIQKELLPIWAPHGQDFPLTVFYLAVGTYPGSCFSFRHYTPSMGTLLCASRSMKQLERGVRASPQKVVVGERSAKCRTAGECSVLQVISDSQILAYAERTTYCYRSHRRKHPVSPLEASFRSWKKQPARAYLATCFVVESVLHSRNQCMKQIFRLQCHVYQNLGNAWFKFPHVTRTDPIQISHSVLDAVKVQDKKHDGTVWLKISLMPPRKCGWNQVSQATPIMPFLAIFQHLDVNCFDPA